MKIIDQKREIEEAFIKHITPILDKYNTQFLSFNFDHEGEETEIEIYRNKDNRPVH